MTRYVLIKRFCELTGYTVKAVEGKIATGAWIEGKEYIRSPDGHVMVSIPGFEKWAEGQRQVA